MRFFSPVCELEDGAREFVADFTGELEEPDTATDLKRSLWAAVFANVLIITSRNSRLIDAEAVLLEGCRLTAVYRHRQDLLSSKAESLLSSQVREEAPEDFCKESVSRGDLEFGFAIQWEVARRVFFAESRRERDEWMSHLERASNWRDFKTRLESDLQEAREAASRYWSRQRALRHHVRKLKSQIACNAEGKLERRCGTQEHDRLCERVVFLEELVEGLEGRLAEALAMREETKEEDSTEEAVNELASALIEEMERETRNLQCVCHSFRLQTQRLVRVLSALSEVLPSDICDHMQRLLKRIAHPVDFSSLPRLALDSIENRADYSTEEKTPLREDEAPTNPVSSANISKSLDNISKSLDKSCRRSGEVRPIQPPTKVFADSRRKQTSLKAESSKFDEALLPAKGFRLFANSPLLSAIPLSPPSASSPKEKNQLQSQPINDKNNTASFSSHAEEGRSLRGPDEFDFGNQAKRLSRIALPNPENAYTVYSPRVLLKGRKEDAVSDSSIDSLSLLMLDDLLSESDIPSDYSSEESNLLVEEIPRSRRDFASKQSEILKTFAALPLTVSSRLQFRRRQRAPSERKDVLKDSAKLLDSLENSPNPSFKLNEYSSQASLGATRRGESCLGTSKEQTEDFPLKRESPNNAETVEKKQMTNSETSVSVSSKAPFSVSASQPVASREVLQNTGSKSYPPLSPDSSASATTALSLLSQSQEQTSDLFKSSLKRLPSETREKRSAEELGGAPAKSKEAKSHLPSDANGKEKAAFKNPSKASTPPSKVSTTTADKSEGGPTSGKVVEIFVKESSKANSEEKACFPSVTVVEAKNQKLETKGGPPKQIAKMTVALPSESRPKGGKSNSGFSVDAKVSLKSLKTTETAHSSGGAPNFDAAKASKFPEAKEVSVQAKPWPSAAFSDCSAVPPSGPPKKREEMPTVPVTSKVLLKKTQPSSGSQALEERPVSLTEAAPPSGFAASEVRGEGLNSRQPSKVPSDECTETQTRATISTFVSPEARSCSLPDSQTEVRQKPPAKDWLTVSRGWSGETWNSFVLGEECKEEASTRIGGAAQARLAQTVGRVEELECEVLTAEVTYEEEGLPFSNVNSLAATTRRTPYDEVSDEEHLLSQVRDGVLGIRVRNRSYILGSKARPRILPQRAAVDLTGRRWGLMRENRIRLRASSARLRRRLQTEESCFLGGFFTARRRTNLLPPQGVSVSFFKEGGRPYEVDLNGEALERLPTLVQQARHGGF